jgi:hypothetical protein
VVVDQRVLERSVAGDWRPAAGAGRIEDAWWGSAPEEASGRDELCLCAGPGRVIQVVTSGKLAHEELEGFRPIEAGPWDEAIVVEPQGVGTVIDSVAPDGRDPFRILCDEIREAVKRLKRGRSRDVWVVESSEELERLFDRLAFWRKANGKLLPRTAGEAVCRDGGWD